MHHQNLAVIYLRDPQGLSGSVSQTLTAVGSRRLDDLVSCPPPLSGRRARTWRLFWASVGVPREGGLEFGEKVEMTADISTVRLLCHGPRHIGRQLTGAQRGTRSWLPIPASDPRPAAYSTSVAEQPSLR